jgi:hypothetical protein
MTTALEIDEYAGTDDAATVKALDCIGRSPIDVGTSSGDLA